MQKCRRDKMFKRSVTNMIDVQITGSECLKITNLHLSKHTYHYKDNLWNAAAIDVQHMKHVFRKQFHFNHYLITLFIAYPLNHPI